MIKGAVNLIRQVISGEWAAVFYKIHNKLCGIDLSFRSLESLGLSDQTSKWYSNSGGPDFDIVLRDLCITTKDSILDIGCGKGGSIITLSKYPFQSVDGVDISEELIAHASSNLRKMHITNSQLFCCNAANFSQLDKYTHIYMYNPFPCNVMMDVVDNINTSLTICHRQLTIIYKNPACHNIIINHGRFEVVKVFEHSDHPFYVYKSKS